MEPFRDRGAAGEQLAAAVVEVVREPCVVLGIPRGGVIVAAPVARRLGAPLDVVVPKKLSAPGRPELGIGAVAPGVRVLDERAIATLGVDPGYLEDEIAREEVEVERRTAAYRRLRPPLDLAGRTAVVVDDGIATGGTARAAIAWARAAGANRVVLAIPVGPSGVVEDFRSVADEVVCLGAPAWFVAVGEWYVDFRQTTDEEVEAALAAGA